MQYANTVYVIKRSISLINNYIDLHDPKEVDCMNELHLYRVASDDLPAFLEAILILDTHGSKTSISIEFFRSFLGLMVAHIVEALVELINSQNKIVTAQNYLISGRAEKIALYGYKKLIRLNDIGKKLADAHTSQDLFLVARSFLNFVGGDDLFATESLLSKFFWKEVMQSFFKYQIALNKEAAKNKPVLYTIKKYLKNSFNHSIAAFGISLGIFLFLKLIFFNPSSHQKMFSLSQSSLLNFNEIIFEKNKIDRVKSFFSNIADKVHSINSAIPVAKDFNWNIFLDLEDIYKKTYLVPFASLIAGILHNCDIALKNIAHFLCGFLIRNANSSELLIEKIVNDQKIVSQITTLLDQSIVVLNKNISIAHTVIAYSLGAVMMIGSISFAYLVYRIIHRFAKIARTDFQLAFELFEKEIYNQLTFVNRSCRYNHGKLLYFECLLIFEAQQIFPPEIIFRLHDDIECLMSLNNHNDIKDYLAIMKQKYQSV